jgi:hypothetical protein
MVGDIVSTIEVNIPLELGGKVMKEELLNLGGGGGGCSSVLFFISDLLHDFENSQSDVKLLHIHGKL